MSHLYRFDDVEIDLRTFRVFKAGKALPLEPKALNVLVFLVESRGRLVEKRELLDAAWGDSFVTENVLTRAVAQLRKALRDDAKEAHYIETVPTRGYRFIADVAIVENGDAPGATARVGAELSSSAAITAQLRQSRSSLRRYAIASVAIVAVACIAIVGLYFAWARAIPGYLQVASNTQITTTAGLSIFPTFSSDGTEIAYSTDRGKGFEIFVRQLTPGGKEFQVTSDGSQNFEPAWSPDGTLIAYFSKLRGGIWLIPALGGEPRKLTDFGSHPAWSHDGQWIAFQSAALNDIGSDSIGVSAPSTIWVVRSDGSGLRRVTNPGDPGEGGHGSPSWSPDAKHIVFVTGLNGAASLWSIGSDGNGLVRLGDQSGGYFDPVYSLDGKSMIYGAIEDRNVGLWQLRVSPDTSAPLGPANLIVNSGNTHFKNLAFSSDGKKLVYAAVELAGSMHSLPVSKSVDPAGEPVALTSNVGCRDIDPAFSPDGSRIAFQACYHRAGVHQQIWMIDADGSNAQELTFPEETSKTAYFPTWFPDGRRILVAVGSKLISVDTDTRQQKVIMEIDQKFDAPQMSPDGTQVALNSFENGVPGIWIEDMASGKVRQLTSDKEGAAYPAWSPDGKWIAAQIQRGADNCIGIVPSTGGPFTQLTPYKGDQWSRSWSPDGDKILYAAPGNDLIWNIWSVSRSTKIQKQLTHYTKTNAYVRYPVMSPRGNQIVYEYTETTGNIWMMQFK